MGYRKISYKEKIKAVEAVNNGMRLSEVDRILGIPKTTISNWLFSAATKRKSDRD